MNAFTKKAVSIAASASIVAMSFAPIAAPLAHADAVVIVDTINGQAPTGFCIAGPLTIVGHGTRGTQGGPYSIDVGNGDGATTTVTAGSGANAAFTFTATFTPTSSGSGLYVNLYHGSPTGQDSHVNIINQCIAPPTQGVVVVKKHVVNNDGGIKAAADFTLHVNGSNLTGSETGTLPGQSLNPGSYPITENTVSGYSQTAFSCTDNGNATTTANSTINVSAGHNYVCTVTNDDVTPTFGGLSVVKNTVGGHDGTFNFTGDEGAFAITTVSGTGIQNFFHIPTGSYSVAETNPSAHWQKSGSCSAVAVTANATTTCTFTNTYVETAPTASNGSVSTNEDTPVSGNLSASDPEGDTLAYAVVVAPTHGTLTSFNPATGAFTYAPTANYNGADSFTFKASDGIIDSNVATQSITVTPVNDAPVALNDSASTPEDTAVSINVGANDSDIDGNPLTFATTSPASHGTVVDNGGGNYTYTPNLNYNGSDSFTYMVDDGQGGTASATVTITVDGANDAPAAVADAYSTNEDTVLTVNAAGVLANDTDADGNALTAVLNTTTTNGVLALASNGSFVYTPNANFNGTDSFTYHANDGQADSSTVTVTITVSPVNDAPVAQNLSLTTPENTPITSGVVATDVDGNALTFATTSNTTNGTLTFSQSTGAFTYTPGVSFTGLDSFTFKANDGSLDSNVATVNITVSSSPACSDRIDNDGDAVVDSADPGCHTDNDANNPNSYDPNDTDETDAVVATSTPNNGGGGGHHRRNGGGGTINQGGEVLGAETGPTDCPMYLQGYIKYGAQNDAGEVAKLQAFLNSFEGYSLPVDGTYGQSTLAAVHAFQTKYAADVLTPWGLKGSTGFVYYTTRKEVNTIYCKFEKQFPLSAQQLQEIEYVKARQGSLVPSSGSSTYKSSTGTSGSTGTGAAAGTVLPKAQVDQNATQGSVSASSQTAAAANATSTSWWTKFVNWLFGK